MNNYEELSNVIKENANIILYKFQLLDKLKELGKPHIVGSYKMDMMAWNDLDIDIENDNVTLEKLYDLTTYITKTFKPVWYEAKEVNNNIKKVWFHGFETIINNELWNVDLWFLSKCEIEETEKYCDTVSNSITLARKNVIIKIKKELISKGLYSFEKFKSIDVYKAVLENDIKTTDEFLLLYK